MNIFSLPPSLHPYLSTLPFTEIDITPDGVNLTSPYFPRPGYLDNFDYTWYLTSPEDHYISLEFSVFDLEYYQDVIFIGEGEDNRYDNADYKLSGEYEVLRILPKSSSVWIRMVTNDNRSPSIGFKVYANAVPIAEAVLRECDPETEFSCKDGSCLGATVVCDGFNQCTNAADEYSCPRTTCYSGAYIPEYERCNRRWFCPEGEDEYYCEPAQVGEVFYMETPIDIDRPTGYQAYSNETWTVATEEGLCLSVYFSSFKTESDYDLWYIGVGNKLSLSAIFLYLSGSYVLDPFLIPFNESFVHFESDGSKNDGYVLMEMEVVNKTELMYCEKGSYVHRKQICDNEWHCLDGRDEVKCDPLPRGENRIITSAYYPVGYPKNTHQVWTFTTEDDLKLLLQVTTLRTEENFDLLRIGSGSSCVEESYASFSGEVDYRFVISQDNTMCVFFSSDYSVENIGMTATVSAVAENDYVICSSDGSVIPVVLQCDFRWNCPAGEDERGCEPLKLYDAIPFESPNFPGAYPPYSYIIYTASSEPGTETYYTFDIFDMEKGTDYLYAGCGPDPFDANTTVVSLTGNEVEPFTLPCNDVWFTFYSDGYGYNIGYSGTTYVVPASDGLVCSEDGSPVDKDAVCDRKWDCLLTGDDERNCPRIPVNQTAYIRSENYPAPYPRDQFSVFTGEAEDGLHALVEFFDFDLQAGDSLTFGCGANPYDDLSVVATFTGGEIPPPLTLECASIWFSLSTTSSEGDNRGFLEALQL
ncbi:hypothetical protein BSL78_07805 [Apostichopus japonicus]|uniref:CUB domain-containing protein n=1 Tax=Stichopus japonicus TaxID=307972 RepID=A0A2G8L4U9_STIJA|nr:hypothetical protein BSL78_07805 [Apostichopus japonicus]